MVSIKDISFLSMNQLKAYIKYLFNSRNVHSMYCVQVTCINNVLLFSVHDFLKKSLFTPLDENMNIAHTYKLINFVGKIKYLYTTSH